MNRIEKFIGSFALPCSLTKLSVYVLLICLLVWGSRRTLNPAAAAIRNKPGLGFGLPVEDQSDRRSRGIFDRLVDQESAIAGNGVLRLLSRRNSFTDDPGLKQWRGRSRFEGSPRRTHLCTHHP